MPTTTRTEPQPILRADYAVPDFLIERVDLRFELGGETTIVQSRLQVRRNPEAGPAPSLVLVGQELELKSVVLDGERLGTERYQLEPESLTVSGVPDEFTLEIENEVHPDANTALEGLYRSGGVFCTQCEAEGFRRITYFLDRPDVMALYSTTIVADKQTCPVMLSNGNRVESGELADGRHWVKWEDPFKKPSYLFALVAGDLRCHADRFTTASGREVALEIWVEPDNIDKCEHAMHSLQNSMRWDEQTFGLEYDLDVYMIVAVNDFNMGAMENKGLNVFNSHYVLALPETATDEDYENIEGVIGHEYFHNWTGNRVTCRDWFQLSLKEGLTVFRDQQFSADMTSKAVKRIRSVRVLRTLQFAEDAGPMAHNVRPDAYIEMNNFYTVTVYNKGAEVVRMMHTLLGPQGFRKGMDLYFQRHDGQAVTCDDFRAAMADATGCDLAQFERWYAQAGTPVVEVEGEHDAAAKTYTLHFRQSCPPTPGQDSKQPFPIPVRMGLLDRAGNDLPLRIEGTPDSETATTRVVCLKDPQESIRFLDVAEPPVPSLLRGFSAPVRMQPDASRADLAFLAAHDSDDFNRWDAGQRLASSVLHELAAAQREGQALRLDPLFVQAFKGTLLAPGLDGSLRALAMTLPDELYLAEEADVVDPEALHAAREFARRELGRLLQDDLKATFEASSDDGPYKMDAESIARRRVKNSCLAYLASDGVPQWIDCAMEQFRTADNMTDSLVALSILTNLDCAERVEALDLFHERWHADPLVMDKWFSIQAASSLPGTLDEVRRLMSHPAFSIKNPNKVRALIGCFAQVNPLRFHDASGAGYRFVADRILELNTLNPQIAARLVKPFSRFGRYDPARAELMKTELERIAAEPELSKDVYEMVSKSLAV